MKIVVLLLLLKWVYADVECPTNFDYVRQLPWDKSSCESDIIKSDCCPNAVGLLGIGVAQYLRDSSNFMFPTYASAVACLDLFQQQLDSLSLSPDLVAICRKNMASTLVSGTHLSLKNITSILVSNPHSCVGIQTKEDWIRKVPTSAMDSACRGDLSDEGACTECSINGVYDAIQKLEVMHNDSTETTSLLCIYYTVLYAAGVANEFGPKNTHTAQCVFRLPFFVQSASDHRVLTYAFIGTATALLLVSALVLFYCLRVRRIHRSTVHRPFVRRNEELLNAAMRPNTPAVWFDIQEIREATDNFNEANLIGQGTFATVYKGTLLDSQQIAVKRFRNCTPEEDSAFLNEVEIVNNIRHRNLVVLRGCCVASDEREGHQRFLIYDYMPNGSLYEHLFGLKSTAQPLSWSQRKNIILGTAKGLAYLHDGIEPAIYHRDIKSTNILLDDEMNACVADFGLARIMTNGEISHVTTRVAGTQGYLAPEYALYGQLTTKNDVYSFGVLLLEMMSGRKALDTSAESVSHYLITDWAWTLVKQGSTREIVDERIQQSGAAESVLERFVLVGILCSHVMVAFRPRMADAVKMLEGEIEIPEIPDRPLPLMLRVG